MFVNRRYSLRLVFYYIVVALAVAVIAMFFISEYSKHVQIGYELTQLRHQRETLREHGRKLEFENLKAADVDVLEQAARRCGLPLVPPASATPAAAGPTSD